MKKGDIGVYEIRIENLQNKPDQRVALSLLRPDNSSLVTIQANELQYKVANNARQIDFEPIQYFRPNDIFSCVVTLRHEEAAKGEFIASVISSSQTTPVVSRLPIRVLP